MRTFKYTLLVLLVSVVTFSCSNDDDDNLLASAYTNCKTTEYLQANRFGIFSMSLELFEKAGYIDLLDQKGVTVFMPTNYNIKNYMARKEAQLQHDSGNENLKYTFDDLVNDIPLFKDSLLMYIVDKEINRSDLEKTKGEAAIERSKLGAEMQIKLKQTKLYTEFVPNSVNKYLYYTLVINGLDDPNIDPNSVPVEDRDRTNYCQTSGLITTNGILHVMRDEHVLFYNTLPTSY